MSGSVGRYLLPSPPPFPASCPISCSSASNRLPPPIPAEPGWHCQCGAAPGGLLSTDNTSQMNSHTWSSHCISGLGKNSLTLGPSGLGHALLLALLHCVQFSLGSGTYPPHPSSPPCTHQPRASCRLSWLVSALSASLRAVMESSRSAQRLNSSAAAITISSPGVGRWGGGKVGRWRGDGR